MGEISKNKRSGGEAVENETSKQRGKHYKGKISRGKVWSDKISVSKRKDPLLFLFLFLF
jgi:hypothetical protein